MSAILDILVVAVLVFSVVLGWKRGFVKSLLHFAGSLISLVLAVVLAAPIGSFFNDLFIADWLSSSVESKLAEQLAAMGDSFSSLFENMPEGFSSLIDRFGIGKGDLEEQYVQMAAENKTDALITEELADYLTASAARAVSCVLAFLIVYIVAFVLVKLLSRLIDPIFRLPLLHTANALLGALLGFLVAIVFLWVAALLIEHVVPYAFGSDSVFYNNFSADNTLLYRFFADLNPLQSLL